MLKFVCAVATAEAKLSSVSWKSVESATTLLMKFFRLSYAVPSAVSVDSPAVFMKFIDSSKEVNTGAELSSVFKKMLFNVPRWSSTLLTFSEALTPNTSGTRDCTVCTFCNMPRNVSVDVSSAGTGIIVASMIDAVCLTRSPSVLPTFK